MRSGTRPAAYDRHLERKPNAGVRRSMMHTADFRCADCGELGERTGHMGCQYPGLHSEPR